MGIVEIQLINFECKYKGVDMYRIEKTPSDRVERKSALRTYDKDAWPCHVLKYA